MTAHILLLGAGFSRNWGGWLASEAFDYLLGCPEVDEPLKNLLWEYQNKGGFEAALGHLQEESFKRGRSDDRLQNMEAALRRMFADMNIAFSNQHFEFCNEMQYSVARFLTKFDAIFTLNQDLLLERFYLNDNVCLMSSGKWDGFQVAGVKPANSMFSPPPGFNGRCEPDTENFKTFPRLQPYFKLHGSINWFNTGSEGLLVLGTKKPALIDRYPTLRWINNEFERALNTPETRLMIMGYGFADDHINDVIRRAATIHKIAIFVIDPRGANVLGDNHTAGIPYKNEFAEDVRTRVVGFSTRALAQTFRRDQGEHGKLLRFFKP